MSTKPASASVPATAAAATGNKPKFDPRYIAPLFVTCVLIGAWFSAKSLENPKGTAAAIATAILCEILLGLLYYRKVPHLASAYVTGISVGILVRADLIIWPYVLCSLLSITSKYVLRVKNQHLWNPSNFGISMMIFLAPAAWSTLSNQFGNSLVPVLVIWCLGIFIIYRLKRLHICATYVGSFLLFGIVRACALHDSYIAEIAPVTGAMYQLFIFFMMTDPRTTVRNRNGQIAVAFLVAAMEAFFRIAFASAGEHEFGHLLSVDAPYFALFFVGPPALLLDMWWTERKKKLAAQTAPAAA